MLAQFLFRARAGQFSSWGAAAGGAPPPRRWLPPSQAQGRVHAASPLTLVLMLLDLAPEGPVQVGTPGPVLQLWWLMGRRWGPWGERDGPSCVAVLRLHRELAGRLSTPQARSMEWAVTHTDQFREDQGDRAGRPPPCPSAQAAGCSSGVTVPLSLLFQVWNAKRGRVTGPASVCTQCRHAYPPSPPLSGLCCSGGQGHRGTASPVNV